MTRTPKASLTLSQVIQQLAEFTLELEHKRDRDRDREVIISF